MSNEPKVSALGLIFEPGPGRRMISAGSPDLLTTITLPSIPNPPSPAPGFALLHAHATHGFSRFEQDNEAPTNVVIGRDTVLICKNTAGFGLPPGVLVYASGQSGGVPTVALAKANSLTTLPCIGLVVDPIANGDFGQIMRLGLLENIDTTAFNVGDQVWVSETNAGEGTPVRPTQPNLVQLAGIILVKDATAGVGLIAIAPFIGGAETGTNAATYTFSSLAGGGAQFATVDNVGKVGATAQGETTPIVIAGVTLNVVGGLIISHA